MLEIGVQTQNAVKDENPLEGYEMLKRNGFDCVDFSLNSYLKNTELYKNKINPFFAQSIDELKRYFEPHVIAADKAGIRIHQMHMPYPNYIPRGTKEVNDFLLDEMAPKSMEICRFMNCRYIVVHGLKMKQYVGSEEAEWQETKKFLDHVLPLAKEYGITICIENIYNSQGGHIVEGPCCDARKAARRIDAANEEYGAEVLGFCFDTGHANLVGIDFESFLTTLGHRLKVLHMHDNDGIRDLHQLPFVYTRTRENTSATDWEGFLRAMKTIDFKGVLSFETAPVLKAFPPEMTEDALNMINRCGRYFAARLDQ